MTNKEDNNLIGFGQQESDTNPDAKTESIKKEAKKIEPPKIKQKFFYDVKVECMLPATLTYRVLAEDAVQAAELIRGKSPNSVQHKLVGKKDLVLRVYDANSCMMRFMKKLLGR